MTTPSDLHPATGRFAQRARAPCTSQMHGPMLVGMTPSRPSSQCTRSAQPVDAARLEVALMKVAMLVAEDPAFAPIFERSEAELAAVWKKEKRLSEAYALELRVTAEHASGRPIFSSFKRVRRSMASNTTAMLTGNSGTTSGSDRVRASSP